MYKTDLEIDFDNLAQNWADQQSFYMKYGEEHANKIRDRDKLKEQLDIVKAERGAYIREHWENEGLIKPLTVDGVKDYVTIDPQVRSAVSDLINANHEMNVLQVAKSAFEHRKKALESLTQLFLIGYFSKPRLQETKKEPYGDPQQKALNAEHNKRRNRR